MPSLCSLGISASGRPSVVPSSVASLATVNTDANMIQPEVPLLLRGLVHAPPSIGYESGEDGFRGGALDYLGDQVRRNRLMPNLFPDDRYDADLVRRAILAADPDREAPLNALLYASGALMASAVLLVTTAPMVLAVAVALIPWLVLAVGGWWWVAPALRQEMEGDKVRRRRLEHAMKVATDVLLSDEETSGTRRVAADYLLATMDGNDRETTALRLLEIRGTEKTADG